MKQSQTRVRLLSVLSAFIIACALQAQPAQSANILGLFTSHSPSHLIVHMSIVKALAEKGHNVTVVTGLQPKVTHKAINVIVIPPTVEDEELLNAHVAGVAEKKQSFITTMVKMFSSMSGMIEMQYKILKDPRFTALYENGDNKFDLVMVGYFMNDFLLGAARKFNCPLVVNWMGPPNLMTDGYVGNPPELSYVPMMNIAVKVGETMTFFQRIQNVLNTQFFRIFVALLDIRMQHYYNDLFGSDKNFPSLSEMKKNVSAVFCNSHFSEGPIRPNVPAIVEIGGIQIKDTPDPLPQDIAEFLDGAEENGAILFSLGSNLKSDHIKPAIMQTIFKVFATLKQNVIWKWEDLENTPGKAKNILYKKWLPQDDILAHPNLKLFITHAGKGGIAESQYHAVPMLTLPMFADQNGNADKVVVSGYGLQLDLLKLNGDEFKAAILEIINNPEYANNIKKFSQLYRDRPMTARQSVVYWIEYIVRYHGAQHMQSPLVHMNAIQSANLDVYAAICLLLYALWKLLKFIANLMFDKVAKKQPNNKHDTKQRHDKTKKVKKAKKQN